MIPKNTTTRSYAWIAIRSSISVALDPIQKKRLPYNFSRAI
jgi:hypothetical protein